MINSYHEVIDTLIKGNIDYKQIVIDLAKENPELFLKLTKTHRLMSLDFSQNLKMTVQFARSGATVDAIKCLRIETGLGLKESKDIIERFQNWLIETNRTDTALVYKYNVPELLAQQERIFKSLVEIYQSIYGV